MSARSSSWLNAGAKECEPRVPATRSRSLPNGNRRATLVGSSAVVGSFAASGVPASRRRRRPGPGFCRVCPSRKVDCVERGATVGCRTGAVKTVLDSASSSGSGRCRPRICALSRSCVHVDGLRQSFRYSLALEHGEYGCATACAPPAAVRGNGEESAA
jgi:hypothetical protein